MGGDASLLDKQASLLYIPLNKLPKLSILNICRYTSLLINHENIKTNACQRIIKLWKEHYRSSNPTELPAV